MTRERDWFDRHPLLAVGVGLGAIALWIAAILAVGLLWSALVAGPVVAFQLAVHYIGGNTGDQFVGTALFGLVLLATVGAAYELIRRLN